MQKSGNSFSRPRRWNRWGRLAGGVAHDYNNTLGVILGYSELLLDRLHPKIPWAAMSRNHQGDPALSGYHPAASGIRKKATISPKVIDLNRQVGDMLKMLQRLIGENLNWNGFQIQPWGM